MPEWGLLEQIAVAGRKGRISGTAINEFCKGGALIDLAQARADGRLTDADILSLLEQVKVPEWDLSDSQARAAEILGRNFVSPAQYCQALRMRVRFTDEELKQLAQIPFSDQVLREEMEATDGNILLFPNHPKVTLPFVRGLFGTNSDSQPCFYSNDWWLGNRGDKFRDNSLPLGWRLIRTRFEPDSTSKTWDDQEKLIPDTHVRTQALEVTQAGFLIYRLQDGKRILESDYAWCQEVDGAGNRVDVGDFGRHGWDVNAAHPGFSWSSLGLLISRKCHRL